MDDEDETTEIPWTAVKHTKWSFIVLGVDLLTQVVGEVHNTLDTLTTMLGQHRQYKIEEDKFYEITRGM